MNKAYSILQELNEDETTRMLYEAREKIRRDEQSRVEYALEEGRKQGEEIGVFKLLKVMLSNGMDIKVISQNTGLTEEEISNIINSNK